MRVVFNFLFKTQHKIYHYYESLHVIRSIRKYNIVMFKNINIFSTLEI